MQIGPNFTNIAARKVAMIGTYGNTVTWNTTTGTASAIVHVSENPTSIRHLVGDSYLEEAMIAGGRIAVFVFKPADYNRLVSPGSYGTTLFFNNQQWTCKPANTETAGDVVQYVCILGVAGGNM